jgi:hypothetical protein
MNNKPGNSLPKDSGNSKQEAKDDRSGDKDVTKNTPRPVREGPENLRQRAEWFRNRGGEK